MRLGFDASPTAKSPTRDAYSPGVQRVSERTLVALEARGDVEVVRLLPESQDASVRRNARRHVRDQRLEGFHSFVSAPVRAGVPTIVTVHELPWKHGARENAGWRHRLAARLAPRLAARVVCPTQHVARDLGRDARVIGWGTGPPFDVEPPAGSLDEPVLERHRLSAEPYLLCPGATRAKKRLDLVLAGLARHVERGGPPLGVVVTGAHTKDLERALGTASRLGLARWVSTLGEVPDEELAALMRLATAVPVLSDSEGFALPVLEALCCGTPVIVPANSAQAEVAGAAGNIVDASDADALADAFEHALETRERRRYALAESVAGRTWERTAEALVSLWHEVLD